MAWEMTRQKIIKAALRKVGAIGQGDNPTADQVSEAGEALNALIQYLAAEQIPLCKIDWIIAKLEIPTIMTGDDDKFYRCIRGHITSTTNRPISGDQYLLYWIETTDAVEIATAIPWALNIPCTSIADILLPESVLHVMKVFIRDTEGADHNVDRKSYEDYGDITDKYSTGSVPFEAWIEKKVPPRITFYPQATAITDYTVHIQCQTVMNDLINATDDPETPRSYYSLLIYNLAADLADEYTLPIQERTYLEQKAAIRKKALKGDNTEDTEYRCVKGAY